MLLELVLSEMHLGVLASPISLCQRKETSPHCEPPL